MRILDSLGHAAQIARRKAGTLVEIGKLKIEIQSEKAAISKVKTRMGELIWQDYEAGHEVAPQLATLCEDIKDSLAAIDILRTTIDTVRDREDAPCCECTPCDCGCDEHDAARDSCCCDCGCDEQPPEA